MNNRKNLRRSSSSWGRARLVSLGGLLLVLFAGTGLLLAIIRGGPQVQAAALQLVGVILTAAVAMYFRGRRQPFPGRRRR